MFEKIPKARADLTPGCLYAIADGDWIYYGQVTVDKSVGFFDRRDRAVAEPEDVLTAAENAVLLIQYPSIGRALRSGSWKKLGRYPLAEAFQQPITLVQWPVGTVRVTVWRNGAPAYETTVDDPEIQDLERFAAWDAEYHVPPRLRLDFSGSRETTTIGGPIWRERKLAEHLAKRSAEFPWFALPDGWVSTKASSSPM